MQNIKIKATTRAHLGKKVNQLRQEKKLPVVLYGKGVKNQNLTVETGDFEKTFKEAGSSTLVNLAIDESKSVKVLIGEVQRHPVTHKILHADLIKVNMKEKLHTDIPLEITGASPAVEELEGNLITNKDAIEVECLPDDLVSSIPVDISILKTFDDQIKISDLQIPEGIEVLADPDEVLFLVTPPRSEEELAEELAPADEAAAVAELEAQAEAEKGGEEGEQKSEE